ncbi:MAG: hypothetical protein J6Y54_02120, partial [Lentisphaeria bacterium]|nr:hypothetical protein [Lentisphaeria bacterium]
EELVEMRPRRGDYPVDTSCRNLDKMDFRCRFLLRNLTDKRVDLTVGFPVSPEAVFIRKPEELDQTKLVSYFNFVDFFHLHLPLCCLIWPAEADKIPRGVA